MNDDLRKALIEQARAGTTIAYGELARRLGLKPPQTIHRLAEALERLMEEDAAACRPLLAALCVGKARPGLPNPGFFAKAQMLGMFCGDPAGSDALTFHHEQLRRAIAFYGA